MHFNGITNKQDTRAFYLRSFDSRGRSARIEKDFNHWRRNVKHLSCWRRNAKLDIRKWARRRLECRSEEKDSEPAKIHAAFGALSDTEK